MGFGNTDAFASTSVFRQPEEPNGRPGVLWFDTSGGNVELNTWNGNAWECIIARGPGTPEYPVEGSIWLPGSGTRVYDGTTFESIQRSAGIIDKAETFVEPDVSLSGSAYKAQSGSVEHGEVGGSEASYPVNTEYFNSTESGIRVIPNTDLAGLSVRVVSSSYWGDLSEADEIRILDSTESVISSVQGPFDFGERYEILAPMASGEQYYVTIYDSGGNMDVPRGDSPTATTPDFDTDSGYVDGFTGQPNNFAFDRIAARRYATDATVYIEWPEPPDIYAWDRALFQLVEDGGSIDVYVEANDGSGWTEVAGPITRGDTIDADPAENVRYRVELSRPDASSNPALNSIYRRYVI